MLKKIALAGIFAVASLLTLGTSNASTPVGESLSTIPAAPVVRGFGPCGAMGGCH
jgi:hypothetical protein